MAMYILMYNAKSVHTVRLDNYVALALLWSADCCRHPFMGAYR